MTDWVRLWHDMPTDPKWRVIARKSGRSISEVIAVFNFVMVNASANATERGRTHNLFADDIAAALDLDEADVAAILAAMEGKVIENCRLMGWDKRQPKREDNSALRAKEWREAKKAERNRTQPNATERPETETETDSSVAKATGADAPFDPSKLMFDAGVSLITAEGKSASAARSWLGKAKRDYGTEAVLAVIGAAKREGAVDVIAFMERSLRTRARTASEVPIC